MSGAQREEGEWIREREEGERTRERQDDDGRSTTGDRSTTRIGDGLAAAPSWKKDKKRTAGGQEEDNEDNKRT